MGAKTLIHVEILTSKIEGKAWECRLYVCSMNSTTDGIYSNKTGRVTERRIFVFIEPPASTLVDYTEGNTTGDAVSTYEDSSPTENMDDICITYSEKMDSLLKEF